MSAITILATLAIVLIIVLLLSPLWAPLLNGLHRANVKPIIISPSYRLGPDGQHLSDIN